MEVRLRKDIVRDTFALKPPRHAPLGFSGVAGSAAFNRIV